MEYRDYYQVLGVGRSATEKEIKSAFRRKAQEYHPDRNPNDKTAEEKFKALNEAYEVLRDPAKRAKYDRLGSSYSQWQQSGRPGGGFDFSQWAAGARGAGGAAGKAAEDLSDLFGSGGFSDFFNILFGSAAAAAAARQPNAGNAAAWKLRGEDQEQPIEITLEEAFSGAQRTLQKGSRRLELKIPPGARTGTRVRMAGAGGEGQTPGDLFLVVNVKPHAHFRREGDDLHVDVPMDLYTALLGGTAAVPTLGGEAQLSVPPEAQAGKTFRLAGQGMPRLKTPTERGDLYAHVVVRIPTHLSERERQLFQELKGLRGGAQNV